MRKWLADPAFGGCPEFYPVHIVAREYGQRPADVLQWSQQEFDQAIMILSAENGAGVTTSDVEENIKERRKDMAENNGFILGVSFNFWRRFISGDGSLDKDALLAANYTVEQFDYIECEMIAAGLLAAPEAAQALSSSDPED